MTETVRRRLGWRTIVTITNAQRRDFRARRFCGVRGALRKAALNQRVRSSNLGGGPLSGALAALGSLPLSVVADIDQQFLHGGVLQRHRIHNNPQHRTDCVNPQH